MKLNAIIHSYKLLTYLEINYISEYRSCLIFHNLNLIKLCKLNTEKNNRTVLTALADGYSANTSVFNFSL